LKTFSLVPPSNYGARLPSLLEQLNLTASTEKE
jgi:hypothetical protein